MNEPDMTMVSRIHMDDLRRCELCGAIDYIGRILRRSGPALNGPACVYCGGSKFWSIDRITRFQLPAFLRFHERNPNPDAEIGSVGTAEDSPVWWPGWCDYSIVKDRAIGQAPATSMDDHPPSQR